VYSPEINYFTQSKPQSMKKFFLLALSCITLFLGNSSAQTTDTPPVNKVVTPIELSGPRVGLTTVLPGKTADDLKTELGMSPTFTQFGWQFEHQYFALENGVAGLVEFIGLIGGLEQGKFLPSASLLVGVRGAQGGEFAFGPNISLTGAGFVFAAGHTYKMGALNFPVNFAVVPSTNGVRMSLLFGFNAQTR
jgi:hypothetical protein